MLKKLKRILIGRPLKNEAGGEEKYGILWGLPILASDAISSVAYAGQEMLLVLVPLVGVAAFTQVSYISLAIIGLLILLMFSYRQTIENYPNGGGAFIVAKDNLGVLPGIVAGAALSVDYIMTVAVSVSSGVEQIAVAFKPLYNYRVLICVVIVLLLMIGNLRGVKESSKLFGIPAYAFIIAMLSLIVCGLIKLKTGFVPTEPSIKSLGQPLTLLLALKTFSSGCTALTGVEAVSNAVPNFKEPSTKHAKTVLLLLSIIILTLFGGISILTNYYHVNPKDGAVLIQMARIIFDNNFVMYCFITVTTFTILVMAANTAFAGFPMLIAVMAKEGYVPRQLSMKGDRLSYSNGILVLSAVACFLIVLFKANVTSLIGLYAIGVFISFTLSQSGMFVRWFKYKGKHWAGKAAVNGVGAFVTAIAVGVIAWAKFHEGAWIVVILIPILVIAMLKVKNHYIAVAKQLRFRPEELMAIDVERDVYRNRVIVPIESINKMSVRALRYARTISDNVIAFNVSIDAESADRIKEKYALLKTDIPLIVKHSPFRKVVDPLLKFIESAEYEYQKGDMITVILPKFETRSWWHKMLHNNSRIFIEGELLKHKHIVVAVMPLQLKDDSFVLKNPKYN